MYLYAAWTMCTWMGRGETTPMPHHAGQRRRRWMNASEAVEKPVPLIETQVDASACQKRRLPQGEHKRSAGAAIKCFIIFENYFARRSPFESLFEAFWVGACGAARGSCCWSASATVRRDPARGHALWALDELLQELQPVAEEVMKEALQKEICTD